MTPQPVATASLEALNGWHDAVLGHIKQIEASRGVNHPISVRLKNVATFMDQQLALIATPHKGAVNLKAGQFHWLLVRLLQRQESMKALIASGDPLVKLLDPKLRREIKRGWEIVKWPKDYIILERKLRRERCPGAARKPEPLRSSLKLPICCYPPESHDGTH